MVLRYSNRPHPIHQLRDDIDRLFSGVMGHWGEGRLPGISRGRPAVNMWEKDDALRVELEVPGLKSDQVEISVVGDELSVKLDRPDLAEEGAAYHRRERPSGSFTRVLRLPLEVDADRVEAELSDGVLTITLPKAESAKPRKIRVTAAS
ncbi:MAG: Hsp20/alpha crystallin family protein [Planctomycetota bacterium]|jgi:HSP20 family protein